MIILYADRTGIWTRTLDRSDSRGPERSVVFGWKFDFCPDRDMAWRSIECDKVLCGMCVGFCCLDANGKDGDGGGGVVG